MVIKGLLYDRYNRTSDRAQYWMRTKLHKIQLLVEQNKYAKSVDNEYHDESLPPPLTFTPVSDLHDFSANHIAYSEVHPPSLQELRQPLNHL